MKLGYAFIYMMSLFMMLKGDDFMLFFCSVMLEVGCYKVYFFISNNLMICGTFVNISLTHVMSCNTTWINNNNNKQA